LEVAWVPRELNAEADAITNGDVSWLLKENEVSQELAELPFLILNEMLKEGRKFYEGFEVANTDGVDDKRDPHVLLKVSSPWD
jgi:hypothetical protein